MNRLNKILHRLDRYQQRHKLTSFIIAVIKKYNDESIGREAALLTYYSFLSLFPLLLILTTVTDDVITKDPHLRATVIKGLTNYFPLFGNQLSEHVHTLKTSGIAALITGLLFTLYGTRGIANSFRRGVCKIWLIPKNEQDHFPKSLYKSLCLVVIGGLGFVIASIIASLASLAGHALIFRTISVVVNLFILFWLFSFLINFSLPKHVPLKEVRSGAAVLAVGLLILQALGGYILARELKKLDALYSYFALALGLLFWLYLQAQVVYYSIEIAMVNSKNLWPRSLNSDQLTAVDKRLIDQVK